MYFEKHIHIKKITSGLIFVHAVFKRIEEHFHIVYYIVMNKIVCKKLQKDTKKSSFRRNTFK